MTRILLHVSYDGTSYSGWQIQPNAPTIEGVLNRELSRLCAETINVIGASRTDAGVHAEDAIAVFDTNSHIPAEKFSYALNTSLPDDIRVVKSQAVADDFHPRKTSTKKTYEYHIYNAEFPNPLNRLYAHHVYTPLNIEAMKKAASCFVGEHDFAGFCSSHTQAETTVRIIYDINISYVPLGINGELPEGEITISVTGNGFLYNMVRIIAGTLIEVGQGKIAADDMDAIIASHDRSLAGNTAPARGLRLKRYEFLDYPEIKIN